jgi:hypothetical protein
MTDWSPSAKHATLYAGPANADQALNLSGGPESYVALPANTPIGKTGTIEMWVLPRSANTWSRFFDFGDKDSADNILLTFNADTGKLSFYIFVGPTPGAILESPGPLPLKEWQHLAVTWNNGAVVIYRNGAPWAQGTLQTPNPQANRKNCYIGRSNWATDKYLDALISEFRIWDRALAQSELNAPLTGREPGLVAYLKGNELTNNVAPDRSPNNRNATAGKVTLARVQPPMTVVADPGAQIRFSNDGGASWTAYTPAAYSMRWPWDSAGAALIQFRDAAGWETTPRLLQREPLTSVRFVPEAGTRALSLDGKTTHVSVAADHWFTGAHTVEAWVYPRNPKAVWCRIIDFGNGPASDNLLFALAGDSGRPCFEVYQGNRSGGKVYAPESLPAGQWVHLAATVDGAGNTILYRNGNFWFAGQTGVPRPLVRRSNFIGRSNWSGDAMFDGMLADVRIWNVVRTQQQIRDGMAGDLEADERGLLGRWLLSEGPGQTVALDTSSRGKHGTFNAPGWVNVAALELGRQPFIRQMRFSPTGGAGNWTDWQPAAPAARVNLWDGCYHVAVQVKDDLAQESQPVVEVAYREPPVTSHDFDGSQLKLSAVSSLGGSCTIYYRLNGGQETVYSAPIALAKGQISTVEYWSVDWAGNRDDRHIYTVQA